MFDDKYDEALEYCKRYVSVSPGDPNPLDTMAELYFYMGRLDDAIENYQEALWVEPRWDAGLPIAYMYALEEDYSETMKWLDKFISQNNPVGRKAEGRLLKGFYYFILGNYDRSIIEINRVKEIFQELGDKFSTAISDLLVGWIHYEEGDYLSSRKKIIRAYEILQDVIPSYLSIRTAMPDIDIA